MQATRFSSATTATTKNSARRRRAGAGFSLVEVMIGLMILGTSSLAALAGLLFSFRTSDANLRALGALAQARSVAEKAVTLDYQTLAGATLPVDVPSSTAGSLEVNEWNERRDDVHGTPTDPNDDLVFSIRPEVTQTNLATGLACSQVIVRYRWQDHSLFRPRLRENALTVVVAQVPSY
jgi:prepilin-type N-terminal cleavage/methylation domain-containing protein